MGEQVAARLKRIKRTRVRESWFTSDQSIEGSGVPMADSISQKMYLENFTQRNELMEENTSDIKTSGRKQTENSIKKEHRRCGTLFPTLWEQ